MIADLKPYPEYKESGLPWLGQVPEHWEARPAFGAFMPNHERNVGMKEKTVLSLSYGRIIIKPVEKLHGLVPESFETYQIVNPGDIVLRTTDLQNDHTSLRVGMVRDRGIITSAYLALQPKAGVIPDFGFQFLNVWDMSKAIYGYGSGLRQNLDFSHFKRMPVAVPPPDEQAAIVRFLDHANRRIERAIRAKKKLIALLNEQKQAIIHRAVTRGLDPTVPLKPSGIPWLGDIPQHWEVVRLKFLVRKITDGEHISPALAEQGIPLLSAKDVRDRKIIYDVDKFVQPEQAKEFWCRCRPQQGDLLIVSRGATIGRVAIVGHDKPFCLMGSVILCNCYRSHSSGFLYYALNAHHAQTSLWFTSASSAQQAIYIKDVAELRLPIPHSDERNAIETHLDDSLTQFYAAITRLEREIELLHEYLTRLVADAVTGKLDVREAAQNLPDEGDAEEMVSVESEEAETGFSDDMEEVAV